MAFLFRIRIAILALLVVATAGAAFWTFHDRAVPADMLLWSAASLLIAAGVAFVQLRHAGLAVLVAVAPLPGMIAAGPVSSELAVSGFLAVYGFGYLAAACFAGEIVRGVLDGVAPVEAARATLARFGLPIALSAVAGAILTAGSLFRQAPATGMGAAGELVCAGISVMAFVPFAAAVLSYGESFFVVANRLRERREGLLRILAMAAEPRWAMSLSGIALVFATLGWFGAAPLLPRHGLLSETALWGASALGIFVVAHSVGRDWRDAIAATLALAALALMSAWLLGRAVGHLTAGAFAELALVAASALLTMTSLIAASRGFRTSGDRPQTARLRAIECLGVAPLFGSLGAAGDVAPWIALHGSNVALSATFLFAGAAGLLAMPALATALETLMRRRKSVDELYGRG